MAVPICPVCGCKAVDSSQQKTLSTQQSMGECGAEVVVCHCAESHRFVVSSKARILAVAQSRSAEEFAPKQCYRQLRKS